MYNRPIRTESTKVPHHDETSQDRDCFVNGCVEVELGIRYELLLHHCRQVLCQRGVLLLQAQLLYLDDLVQLLQLLILPADAAKRLQWEPLGLMSVVPFLHVLRGCKHILACLYALGLSLKIILCKMVIKLEQQHCVACTM